LAAAFIQSAGRVIGRAGAPWAMMRLWRLCKVTGGLLASFNSAPGLLAKVSNRARGHAKKADDFLCPLNVCFAGIGMDQSLQHSKKSLDS